jgi:dipeptidyl aminopeptidase/acylaminoacyl peptidase
MLTGRSFSEIWNTEQIMKRWSGLLVVLLLTPIPMRAEGKRPITIADMFRFKRVADPRMSPDGKLVAYALTDVNLAANKTSSSIWLAPTDRTGPRQLTNTTKKDHHPRWSPDGKKILFESNRSGDNQLWVIDLSGGEARQLTTIATEAGNAIWSPDGKWIAFVSAVYPEFSDRPYAESNTLNKNKLDEKAKSPVKARVFRQLFFRHWDDWVENKRQHLFIIPAEGGEPKDLTPGDHDAYPTSTTFSAGDDFTFTPDSKAIVYTAPPEKNEAWSTDYNLYRVALSGGPSERLTDNPAADGCPVYSPDGRYLAYRAQKRPGFEADRWEIMLMESAGRKAESITADFDSSPGEICWAPSSDKIYFTADDKARAPIYEVALKDRAVKRVLEGHQQSALTISNDGSKLAFSQAALTHPAEVMMVDPRDPSAGDVNLSQANTKVLGELDLSQPESVTVTGAGGTPMQMWIIHPPKFDPAKKWPLVYLVHGGPQGAWEDGWSYRWCPELWAAQGYVVACPNPRGSTGFGQKYVDEISGDWGGKCFDDLMAGADYMEKQPYIDKDRMASAGASFGGYMENWFEGHTNRFKTLISHDGVYNFDSMYTTTDELWFDEWEHGGTPWEKPEEYMKFSPHRYAKNFKTPMLLIHGDQDFRCPVSEGLQLFTALQRLGIEAKMVNFPDEGHWVLKPANSEFWHREVFAWLKAHVPPGPR